MSFEVNPLGDALGAEVIGLDLREPPDPAAAQRLNQALLEHIVLVIRDQHLDPGQYVRAMRSFGEPARQNHAEQLMPGHPEIWIIDSREAETAPDGRRLVFGANCWHTDHTNLPRPPKITALYAARLPPTGGDTRFANAYAMYERLSPATRERIGPLRTVNGADRHLAFRAVDAPNFAEPAVHPLVRTHPETGRQAIYVHPLKTHRIEGMEPDESFTLIDSLIEEGIDESIVYQHSWRMGDLVLIDNRACMHVAVRDYDPDVGRVMHRVVIEGDTPR